MPSSAMSRLGLVPEPCFCAVLFCSGVFPAAGLFFAPAFFLVISLCLTSLMCFCNYESVSVAEEDGVSSDSLLSVGEVAVEGVVKVKE